MTSAKVATRYLARAIKNEVITGYQDKTGVTLDVQQLSERQRSEDCDEELIITPACRAYYLRVRIDVVDKEYLIAKLSPEEKEVLNDIMEMLNRGSIDKFMERIR